MDTKKIIENLPDVDTGLECTPEDILMAMRKIINQNKENKMEKIRFMLDGCDICFIAEAPADITLKELLTQTDKIKPHWCACGIRSLANDETYNTDIFIEKDSIRLANEDVAAEIIEDGNWFNR